MHSISLLAMTPYYPYTNSKVERFNSILEAILAHYYQDHPTATPKELLRYTIATYNRTPQELGYSSHFLLYGMHPKEDHEMEITVY